MPLLRGDGSSSNTTWPGPRPTSVPNGILVRPAVWPQYMGRKVVWAGVPPLWGELGSNLTQCRLGRGLFPSGILIHPAIWPQQTWAENLGLCPPPPFFWGGAGFPLTQCGRADAYLPDKFHFDPSNHFATIHQRSRQTVQASAPDGESAHHM